MVGAQPDSELGSAGPASWRRGDANSTMAGRRVRQHRSFASRGKARPDKYRESRGRDRTREIRPSGIVERLQETWPVGMFSHAARAPDFYLDRVTMAPPMRWRPVRAQRSVGVGVRAGRWDAASKWALSGCRRAVVQRKATSVAALSRAVIGPRGVEEPVHVRDLFMLRTGRSRGHPPVVMAGRVVRGTPMAVIP